MYNLQVLLLLFAVFSTVTSLATNYTTGYDLEEDNNFSDNAESDDNYDDDETQIAMKRDQTPEQFFDAEKGWINVFLKHLALHQKWAVDIAGVTVNAHFYGMIAAVLFRALKGANDKSGGTFNKIRAQVDKRISYHINKDKIYRAHKIFDNQVAKIVAKMYWRKGTELEGYQYEDLLDLRSYLPDFLPIEPSADFDVEWFQLMANYLILYKNFYSGLIQSGKLKKCVFVQDWNTHLKSALKKSTQRLSYSYFSHFQKKSRGARLTQVIDDAWLSFEDKLSDPPKEYRSSFTNIEEEVLDALSDHVAEIMWTNIGESYNDLLEDIPSAERTACGGVELLTKEDLKVTYPKDCYGKKVESDETKQCDLPCGKYGTETPYCIYFHGEEAENTEMKVFSKNNALSPCQGDGPDYWRTCTSIEKLPDIATWDKSISDIQEGVVKKKGRKGRKQKKRT